MLSVSFFAIAEQDHHIGFIPSLIVAANEKTQKGLQKRLIEMAKYFLVNECEAMYCSHLTSYTYDVQTLHACSVPRRIEEAVADLQEALVKVGWKESFPYDHNLYFSKLDSMILPPVYGKSLDEEYEMVSEMIMNDFGPKKEHWLLDKEIIFVGPDEKVLDNIVHEMFPEYIESTVRTKDLLSFRTSFCELGIAPSFDTIAPQERVNNKSDKETGERETEWKDLSNLEEVSWHPLEKRVMERIDSLFEKEHGAYTRVLCH